MHFWRSDANVGRISAGRVHISRYAPAVGQRVTIRIGCLCVQRNCFTGLNGNGFHSIDYRRLVGFRRFIHNLDVNSIAQPFSVGYGQTEDQVLVACHSRNAKAGFRFGAIGDGHRRA